MADTKHTPGPWLRDGTTVYALTLGPDGNLVNRFSALFQSAGQAHEADAAELEANAHLASLAPELLDSLCEMTVMALRNDIPMDVQIARAERAIALLERLGVQA